MLESFVLPLAKYLRKKGHCIEMAATPYMPRGQKPKFDILEKKGFKVHILDFDYHVRLFKDITAIARLFRFLLQNKFDIIHIQSSKAGVIGRIAAKLAGCPIVIYTANDFYYLDSSLGKTKKLFYFLAEKISAYFCDVMLFISDSVHKEAVDKKLKSENRMHYLGPPIQDYKSFTRNAAIVEQTRNKLDISKNDLLIGCVTRLVSNKGVDLFIQTAVELIKERSNLKFIIIGDGPLYQELKKMVHDQNYDQKILFTGFIESYSNVLELMSSLDIFFLPTRREGFGLVFAEALSFKIPVVGPDIAPINEFVENGISGLLTESGDITAYKISLLKLIDDKELRIKIGSLGREKVCNRFKQEDYFQNTLSIYTKMLNQTDKK